MICIVSPHLDDAALSCADHALAWRAAGEEVMVINVFDRAGTPSAIAPFVADSIRSAGAADAAAYEAMRVEEDTRCLQALDVSARNLGLIDAGFRGADAPDYPTIRALLPGRLAARELALVARVLEVLDDAIAPADKVSLIIGPLGIGGHVDHLIARAACERLGSRRLGYYADMPYARAPWNWPGAALLQLLRARTSIKRMSDAKRSALAHYRSQMPLLFRRGPPRYPEVLLLPHG